MNVKATISFTGALTMRQGEERELWEESPVLHDLLSAGYVVGVDLAGGTDKTGVLKSGALPSDLEALPTVSVQEVTPVGDNATASEALPIADAQEATLVRDNATANVGAATILAEKPRVQELQKTAAAKKRGEGGKK